MAGVRSRGQVGTCGPTGASGSWGVEGSLAWPPPRPASPAPPAAQEGDSPGQKLSGAVVNALIFVGVVAAMTFALVLLFKHGVS